MIKRLCIFFLICAGCGQMASAADEPVKQQIKLTYKAYWGGFVISEIKSTAILSPSDYDITLRYKVKGLATIFSSFKSNLAVSGKIMPDQTLQPDRFYNKGSWSKNFFEAKTRFSPDDSKIIDHQFDFKFDKEAKYIPVKEDRQFGPDLVSYYLGLMLMNSDDIEREKPKHQNVFGGFFLLDMAYHCPREQTLKTKRSMYRGQVTECEFTDKIVDGKFVRTEKPKKKKKKRKSKRKKKKKNKEPEPVKVWFAQVGDVDARLPVYSEFAIGWGKVRIYLADMEVTTMVEEYQAP